MSVAGVQAGISPGQQAGPPLPAPPTCPSIAQCVHPLPWTRAAPGQGAGTHPPKHRAPSPRHRPPLSTSAAAPVSGVRRVGYAGGNPAPQARGGWPSPADPHWGGQGLLRGRGCSTNVTGEWGVGCLGPGERPGRAFSAKRCKKKAGQPLQASHPLARRPIPRPHSPASPPARAAGGRAAGPARSQKHHLPVAVAAAAAGAHMGWC